MEKWNDLGAFDVDSALDIIRNGSSENSNIARAYGLIAVHEEDFPVRVIVSTIGSPTYF